MKPATFLLLGSRQRCRLETMLANYSGLDDVKLHLPGHPASTCLCYDSFFQTMSCEVIRYFNERVNALISFQVSFDTPSAGSSAPSSVSSCLRKDAPALTCCANKYKTCMLCLCNKVQIVKRFLQKKFNSILPSFKIEILTPKLSALGKCRS